MNEEEDPKQLLRSGKAIVVVELFEVLGMPAQPRVMIATDPRILDTVVEGQRSQLMAAARAWQILVQQALNNPDNPLSNINPTDENPYFPPASELVVYVGKTLEIMEKKWPYEAEFVRTCVFDADSALDVVSPFLIPGGLEQVKTLIPSSRGGYIYRVPSPVSFFPHPPEERNEQVTIAGKDGTVSIRGASVADVLQQLGHTDQSDDEPDGPSEFEFPAPK